MIEQNKKLLWHEFAQTRPANISKSKLQTWFIYFMLNWNENLCMTFWFHCADRYGIKKSLDEVDGDTKQKAINKFWSFLRDYERKYTINYKFYHIVSTSDGNWFIVRAMDYDAVTFRATELYGSNFVINNASFFQVQKFMQENHLESVNELEFY